MLISTRILSPVLGEDSAAGAVEGRGVPLDTHQLDCLEVRLVLPEVSDPIGGFFLRLEGLALVWPDDHPASDAPFFFQCVGSLAKLG